VKGGGSADQGRRRRAAHLQEPVRVLLLEERRSRTAPASGWGGLAGYDLRGRSGSRRGWAGAALDGGRQGSTQGEGLIRGAVRWGWRRRGGTAAGGRRARSGLGGFLARKGQLMTDSGLLFGRLADYLKITLLAAG
jgi:hypothetical protein